MKLILLIKRIWGLAEMTFRLVNANFSLPEWQAVKMTFFAPLYIPIFLGFTALVCEEYFLDGIS